MRYLAIWGAASGAFVIGYILGALLARVERVAERSVDALDVIGRARRAGL